MLFRLIYLLLLLLLPLQSVWAQVPFAKDIWLNESNTPTKVNAIAKDRNGYLWLGTEQGLYRYNGRSFTLIKDSLNHAVTALTVSGGSVYAGYKDGDVGVVVQDVVNYLPRYGSQPQVSITNIKVIAPGSYILTTEGDGIYIFINGKVRKVDSEFGLSDNYVYELVAIDSNRYLAATDRGINELTIDKGKVSIKVFTTECGLPDNIIRVIEPMPDYVWSWVGTHNGGLALYCSRSREVWPTDSTWKWGQINDIYARKEGKAWVSTEDGYLLDVAIDDSGKLQVEAFHYPNRKLKDIVIDKSGNIWCATNVGLLLVTAEYMEHDNFSAPYALGNMTAMTCDKNNVLWYALGNKLYSTRLKGSIDEPQVMYTAKTTITSLYSDNIGRLWIGTFADGVWWRTLDGQIKHLKGTEKVENETILDISGTKDKIWISGLNGVKEFSAPDLPYIEPELIMMHNKSSGVGSDYVYQVYPDKAGNIWMATDGAGVCKYSNGKYQHWDSSFGMNSKVVYTLTEDANGNIWAATFNDGVYRYDGKRWVHYNKESGLQDLNISAIAANNTGQVFVVNGKGIDEWDPASRAFRHYNRRLGLQIDSTSPTLKLLAKDTAGNVYIPYQDGVIKFKNRTAKFNINPDLCIHDVSVFFNSVPLSMHEFKHDDNHISIFFDGIGFFNARALKYRYKLEGFNDTWIETNDESVTFPNLPTGDYKFIVQASYNSDFSAAKEASYYFSIDKPFWLEIWFLLLVGVVIWFVALAYIRFRERGLRKVSQLQEERMQFEYEHLKSQVNPHFLFNSLNTLTSLIEEDTKGAVDYTEHLSDLYRNMLSYTGRDTITLAEELEILENYLYVQQSRFGSALRMEINIPDKLRKMKSVIPMALQLLVENALKHNIVAISKPLTIKIEVYGDSVMVSNNLQPKISKEKGAGLGLINIVRRYSLLTNRQVKYGEREGQYIVILPLL